MPAAKPKAKGVREPAVITRRPVTFYDPLVLSANQWRGLVGGAPVVRACIQTMIMQITGLEYRVESEDEKAIEYYTELLETADDGGGFQDLVARVIEDTLTIPFGGAIELGRYGDGVVAWAAHLDSGLMKPTYDDRYPYAQLSPYTGALNPVLFREWEVVRIKWQPQVDTRSYGWTKTPCMDCLPAIQGLLRSDRFWQAMTTDSPPLGILDMLGVSEDDARTWLEGWKTMMAGIDPYKIPIMAGDGREAEAGHIEFISFARSATDVSLEALVKRYAELVTANFGMFTADLGLFGQEMRLAGATKMMDLSKRQGLAHLLRRLAHRINADILPDGVWFFWNDVDVEDTVRKESAKKLASDRLKALVDSGTITPSQSFDQAVAEGLLTIEEPQFAGGNGHEPPDKGGGGKPKSDDAADTKGKELGDDRSLPPKGEALLRQGSAEIPPRAFPTSSKAARDFGKVVGPAMMGVAQSFTRARISKLVDVGIEAGLAAEGRTIEERASPAEQAIEALLRGSDWWKAPDIVEKTQEALRLAYEEGLIESSGELASAFGTAGISPSVGITSAKLTARPVLEQLRNQAMLLQGRIDEGTLHFAKQEIMKGVRQGIGTPEISRRILKDRVRRGVLETFRGRALSIVNTEVNKAATSATIAQQEYVGLTRRVWHIISVDLACEICIRNSERGPVEKGDTFESVFGPVEGPPAHPRVCHCWIDIDREELREKAGLHKKDGTEPEYWDGGTEA